MAKRNGGRPWSKADLTKLRDLYLSEKALGYRSQNQILARVAQNFPDRTKTAAWCALQYHHPDLFPSRLIG